MNEWVAVGAGLVLLVLGGNALVTGAAALALRLGIPVLIVGLTVVAMGTSSPELIVSLRAAIAGETDIAIGNIVGSNIANILIILGLPALIAPIAAAGRGMNRSWVVMMVTAVVFTALCFTGTIGLWQALILLAGMVLSLWDNVRQARAGAAEVEDVDPAAAHMPWWRILGLIAVGLVALGFGADMLVTGAVTIATAFGVPEVVIGLTLVAVGTSLPELATSLIAAIRGETEVALGNVVGSNTLNILVILGITGVISPMPVPPEFLTWDLWVMLAASVLLGVFILGRIRLGRIAGAVFLGLYAAYAVSLVA